MSGILRLANTGAGTGRSTLQSAASNDVTFNLPDTGADSTATILTSELHSITSVNWDGMTINITNADFNVDNGTLFVDESTNRVGIGTNAPAEKLTVADIAAASGFSATNLQLLRSNYGGQIGGYIDQGVSNGLVFSTVSAGTASEKVRILNNGNVGVGTSSPATNLEVSGSGSNTEITLVRTDAATAGNLVLMSGSNTNNIFSNGNKDLTFSTNSSEKARILSNGNVGIGTTSPTALLDIRGTANSSTRTECISFGRPDSNVLGKIGTGFDGENGIFIDSEASHPIAFQLGGVEKMRVANSGNVGIGTDAPTNGKLVIGGSPTAGKPAINVEPYGANYTDTSDITLSSNAVISAQNTINFNIVNGSITFNRGGGSRTGLSGTTESARIDSSGRLLVGYSKNVSQGGFTPIYCNNTLILLLELVFIGGAITVEQPSSVLLSHEALLPALMQLF